MSEAFLQRTAFPRTPNISRAQKLCIYFSSLEEHRWRAGVKSPPEEGISDAKSILEEGTSGAKPVPEEPGRREVTALVHRSCELLPTPWARRTTPPSSVHVETPSPSQITEHHYESTAFTPTSSPSVLLTSKSFIHARVEKLCTARRPNKRARVVPPQFSLLGARFRFPEPPGRCRL